MPLERPLGTAEAAEALLAAARAGRLPHALLLVGPDGIGKFLAARWLAAGLLCERGPAPACGGCGPCKRVAAGSHPDLLVIDPRAEGEDALKIERIASREEGGAGPALEDFLALRPAEGGWRVALVRDADLAGEGTQNALLKMLEEPGANTLLALVTAHPGRLLPTVRSRCAEVPLAPPSVEACAALLEARGLAREEATELARRAGGAPGRALALAAAGGLLLARELEELLAGRADPFESAQALLEAPGETAGKTPTRRARNRARLALDLALELLRDRARALAGVDPARLPHGAAIEAEGGALAALGADGVQEVVEGVLEARADLERNLAPEAVLERAALLLARARHRPPAPHR